MRSLSDRPDGTRRSYVQRGVLALLCSMSFLLYLDRVNLAAAAGPIKTELGLSNTTLGVAFSAFGYTYLIFQIVGGWLADRICARRACCSASARVPRYPHRRARSPSGSAPKTAASCRASPIRRRGSAMRSRRR
jgi:MFS family permease